MDMQTYRFCSLYSGSRGNSAYLETPHARILIDAGKCTRTLVSSLASIGVDIDTIDAIFVTHDHGDHVAALENLAKKHPIPVHILYESALRYKKTQPRDLCQCLHLYKSAPFTAMVGDVTVTSFKTPHDSRASVGYRFEITDTDHGAPICIGYATDIGYVSPEVREGMVGCETVVLESNHDEEMLMSGPYPYDLKLRIRSRHGHLSNRECADFASDLAAGGCRRLLLAHLSEENNIPAIAYDETFAAVSDRGVDLRIAAPDAVTMLVGEATAVIPKTPLAGGEVSL